MGNPMETKNAFLAIMLSMAILLSYQLFFAPKPPPPDASSPQTAEQPTPLQTQAGPAASLTLPTSPTPLAVPGQETAIVQPQGKDITVETSLYAAVVSETGGGIKSFKLKKYKESLTEDSDFKELIQVKSPVEFPLNFSWGIEPARTVVPVYAADKETVFTQGMEENTLTMHTVLPSGIEMLRTLTFSDSDYLMQLTIDVYNGTANPLQGAPYLSLTNSPFSPDAASRFFFTGPAVLQDGILEEIKVDDLLENPRTVSGTINWTAYEDTYFMCGVIPEPSVGDTTKNIFTVSYSAYDTDKVTTVLSGAVEAIEPQTRKQYSYTIYFGPKKLDTLKEAGHSLDKIVDFGWWDFIAKPTLYLLNLLYKYVHNYGVAIILVTIIIKLLFWPISAKGMKSMKKMQKLQPKMAKLREKFKDDKDRLNQEMIGLYKTYKVNPVGGCLPMVLQIPVFFALYKVLLQTIELRHAPFMLWITDLSAPDRLYIGFDIPYLGGIPILTLLMGGSMFLQQKMTPTAADPTQAKVMMFLPVIFTFMFLNFASGLVLYWLLNNLLAIGQQYAINRQDDA